MTKSTANHAPSAAASHRHNPMVRRSIWSWSLALADHASTVVVLAALAAVAFFGHRYGWRIPKASEIRNGTAASVKNVWCAEHGVPESQCVECRTELLANPTDFGWCKVHGVSQCPLCHPEVAQTKEPVLDVSRDLARVERALAMRPRKENNPRCTLYRRRLQFASLEAVDKVGIDVEPVDRGSINEIVTANGEITYDQTRVAHLPAKSAGSVWRVERKLGDRVASGDVLALIDAVEVGRSKAEFMEAIAKWEFASATKQRISPLTDKGAVPESRMLETEAAIRETWSRVLRAQQALVNLGLPISANQFTGKTADQVVAELQFSGIPNQLMESLDRKSTTSNLLAIRAPFDSIIVETDVVVGEVVDTHKPLFTLADTKQMWLMLEIPAEDAEYIAIGQIASFRSSSNRVIASGRIEWISTEADPQTRTVKARATIDNADGKLRNETFGTAQIVLRSEEDAIILPIESLQWDGSCHVVFVRDKNFFASEQYPKLFYPRPVRVGARTDESIEILAGVLPGEVVATKGSGVLRGELLKNNLGAG